MLGPTRLLPIQRLSMCIRINRDSANAHDTRRTDSPANDFTPIGDKEVLDHTNISVDGPVLLTSCLPCASLAIKWLTDWVFAFAREDSICRHEYLKLHSSVINLVSDFVQFRNFDFGKIYL